MGNAGSAHAQASLQVVARLSGDAPLPLAAPEWQQLLGYSTPLSRFDPDEVEREIRPHCAELGAWQRGRGGCSGVCESAPERAWGRCQQRCWAAHPTCPATSRLLDDSSLLLHSPPRTLQCTTMPPRSTCNGSSIWCRSSCGARASGWVAQHCLRMHAGRHALLQPPIGWLEAAACCCALPPARTAAVPAAWPTTNLPAAF